VAPSRRTSRRASSGRIDSSRPEFSGVARAAPRFTDERSNLSPLKNSSPLQELPIFLRVDSARAPGVQRDGHPHETAVARKNLRR